MKKITSLILVLAMCLTLFSCTVDPEKYSLALAAKPMEVKYSDAKQDGYEEFIDKLDSFAAKLTYEVYADSNMQTNICISPVSIYMALALATECASGETRDEILNAVGVTYGRGKEIYEGSVCLFQPRVLLHRSVPSKKAPRIWRACKVHLGR